MRVGVIGAGHWGRNLVHTFHALGALAAVAEVSPERTAALQQQYPGVPTCPDYRQLLETDIPAVAIATPAQTHYQVARDALAAGKDVFVEKPLTLAAAEAEDLVTLARAGGRVLMVGHLLLFQPAIQWLKTYLDSGALGTIHSLHQERLNLGRARAFENVLWSFGVHDIAVLLYLAGGPPAGMQATGQCVLQPAIADDVHLHLAFAGNTHAHLHVSWLWPEKQRRLTVVGSRGMLLYDELAQTVTLHRKSIGADLAHHDAGSEVLFHGSGEPLRLELEHFLAALQTRQTAPADGANGAAVVRVLESATRLLEEAKL